MDEVRIEPDDLSRPAVHALLREHLDDMYATSPPESVHALDLEGLRAPGMSFWTAWCGAQAVGCVALKRLDERHAELKSMRTSAVHRGQGLGTLLLAHVLEQARTRGYGRVSLETGSQGFFAPARRLYARHGFTECEPFGDYRPDPHSVFMTLELPVGTGSGVQLR